MKVTVISPSCIEVEQSETEWLQMQSQLEMDRAAVRGLWKEGKDLHGITWELYRSIVEARMYAGTLARCRVE